MLYGLKIIKLDLHIRSSSYPEDRLRKLGEGLKMYQLFIYYKRLFSSMLLLDDRTNIQRYQFKRIFYSH